MYALIYHDTHIDPEIYVGTLGECQRACRVLVEQYLGTHRWTSHNNAAMRLAEIADDAEAAEWAMNYCNESVEYVKVEIVEAHPAESAWQR